MPSAGFGLYCNNVAPRLGEDGTPVFTGQGFKVTSQWRDRFSRPICHLLYDRNAGDTEGTQGTSSTGGIQSAATFQHWFHDYPSVNQSRQYTLTLMRQEDGTYVFDDKLDPQFEDLGGFFPIEDALFGNPGGNPDRNFHFTFELHTQFVYQESENQVFEFIGDDDVWVYINGDLVIDLGGVHSARNQFVELNRLNLQSGQTYTLDFFFAERHRTQSNFRIETNINLETIELPSVTAAFD